MAGDEDGFVTIRASDANDYCIVVTNKAKLIVQIAGWDTAEKLDEQGETASFRVRADLMDLIVVRDSPDSP